MITRPSVYVCCHRPFLDRLRPLLSSFKSRQKKAFAPPLPAKTKTKQQQLKKKHMQLVLGINSRFYVPILGDKNIFNTAF